ncbi:hypothetical protein ABPG75_000363 [Micractinium tetrahymenae]
MQCACGYAASISIGLVSRGGEQFASKISLACSDGSILRDPVSSYVGVVRNATSAVCNPSAGGCAAMAVQYDLVEGRQANTQLANAGRPGAFTTTTSPCPSGTVLLGFSPRRYSVALGSSSILTGVLNNITAVCGVPTTTGVCAPKSPPPPPRPPPRPPPPKPPTPISNLAFQLKCTCGYAESLTVGFVTRNGAGYASKLTLHCSDGSVVRDPVTTVGAVRNVDTPVCNATSQIQGQLAGGCTAMTIQYDRVQGKEADTQISNAGRRGTFVKSTVKCPAGRVMLGLSPRRYSGASGAASVLNGILNSIEAICGVPATTGVCAPKQPLSPPPCPPPPVRTPQNTAVRRECTCGYVSSLEVGFINVGGKSYASRMNVRCSSGQVLKDATTTLPTTWQTTPACVGAGKLTSGPNAGACTSFTVRYEKVLSQEADVGIVNAGRFGTNSYTPRCSSGVLIGIAFRRYSGGPGFNSLNNIMNTVTAVCGPPAIKACPSPPPPVKIAQGWGDPHFKGFDGSRFEFHGEPGRFYDVLSSRSPTLSLATMVERSSRNPKTTYMREYNLRINSTVVDVKLLPPLPTNPAVWRITATVNSKPIAAGTTKLPNGITVSLTPGAIGKFGTVKVDAGFIFVSMIQKWRPDRAELAEFMDLNVVLRGRLSLPVTGILAPSYIKAVAAAGPVSGAAGGAVLSAGLDVPET